MILSKICRGCQIDQPLDAGSYYRSKDTKDGFCSRCRTCSKQYQARPKSGRHAKAPFDPQVILADWRQLAERYAGTSEGARFTRLADGLEQSVWAMNWTKHSLETGRAVRLAIRQPEPPAT